MSLKKLENHLNNNSLSDVEQIIGYVFKDKSLLMQAFTHSSFSNEHINFGNYERLEFIGDAILELSVSKRIFKAYPSSREGELTKMRANLVNADILAEIIDDYGIIDYLRVGAGKIRSEVNNSKNVKCDLFEAIIGAIALDNDFNLFYAEKFLWEKLNRYVGVKHIDYKSNILEYCAKNKIKCEFKTEKNQSSFSFISHIILDGELKAEGNGKNKLEAEQAASKSVYTKYFK